MRIDSSNQEYHNIINKILLKNDQKNESILRLSKNDQIMCEKWIMTQRMIQLDHI